MLTRKDALLINGKHGQGNHSTKMGADKSAQNTPKFICPNFLPKPKILGSRWKKASNGFLSSWGDWSSRTPHPPGSNSPVLMVAPLCTWKVSTEEFWKGLDIVCVSSYSKTKLCHTWVCLLGWAKQDLWGLEQSHSVWGHSITKWKKEGGGGSRKSRLGHMTKGKYHVKCPKLSTRGWRGSFK